jgi:glyoxylase-like metal-dependent hydrolase (beta-lactamase superfamily II)
MGTLISHGVSPFQSYQGVDRQAMGNRYFHIYRSESQNGNFLAKGSFYVSDRPGELARLASAFAEEGANITLFHYNRSEHPNRVLIEAVSDSAVALGNIGRKTSDSAGSVDRLASPELELKILDVQNILNIEVGLTHQPGSLSAFAALLSRHDANVLYMAYNEDMAETSAGFAIAVRDTNEISVLLNEMNNSGYCFHPIYKGASQREADDIIGLNLMERFFFHLKRLMNTEHIGQVRRLVESSGHIARTLLQFSREAGRHLEAGDVITNVLAFASASLTRTGEHFSYRRLPVIELNGLKVHVFRMPTGGNIIVTEKCGDYVMIDGGYGLYYEDVKKMFRENGIEPGMIKRIYLTHADADHAGLCGYFAEEFGSRVWMHAGSRGIIENENRAWGSGAVLLDLNHYFTSLVNSFTRFSAPEDWTSFGDNRRNRRLGGFQVIDSFAVADETFLVLESLGGHVAGQVFFLNEASGLLFSGDYLLLIKSLETEERDLLNIPKFILTSTNVNSGLFRQEMDMLRTLLAGRKAGVVVIPGHGDYYTHTRQA